VFGARSRAILAFAPLAVPDRANDLSRMLRSALHPRTHLIALMTLTSMGAGGGCARGPAADPAPEARRALLLDPSAPFWRMAAPDNYDVRIETTKGSFVLEIVRASAPRGADRFYRLVRAGYYDDTRFTRVVPGFIAQFGISGDSAVNAVWSHRGFFDDAVHQSNVRGTIAFAMTGPNERTTQLYINLADNRRLDDQGFAPIGSVIHGMDVVDALYSGYGEKSGGGVRAGNQGPLLSGGNGYVDAHFPLLDHLISARICPCPQ
jgi:homoserine O-acetyltransferase/O-succinyltransferase